MFVHCKDAKKKQNPSLKFLNVGTWVVFNGASTFSKLRHSGKTQIYLNSHVQNIFGFWRKKSESFQVMQRIFTVLLSFLFQSKTKFQWAEKTESGINPELVFTSHWRIPDRFSCRVNCCLLHDKTWEVCKNSVSDKGTAAYRVAYP